MEPINPYAPPTTELGPDPTRSVAPNHAAQRARRGRLTWLILFGANLIAPGVIAGSLDRNGADKWLGITLAALGLAGIGWRLLVARPALTGVAVRGALLMALSQFFPVAQMAAGMLGVGLVQALPEVGENAANRLGLIRGFAATIVTGGALLAASFIAGIVLRGVGRFFQVATAPEPRSSR